MLFFFWVVFFSFSSAGVKKQLLLNVFQLIVERYEKSDFRPGKVLRTIWEICNINPRNFKLPLVDCLPSLTNDMLEDEEISCILVLLVRTLAPGPRASVELRTILDNLQSKVDFAPYVAIGKLAMAVGKRDPQLLTTVLPQLAVSIRNGTARRQLTAVSAREYKIELFTALLELVVKERSADETPFESPARVQAAACLKEFAETRPDVPCTMVGRTICTKATRPEIANAVFPIRRKN